MVEEWKPIIGYEPLYAISNKGKVKSLRGSTKVLKGKKTNGYIQVD
jgi:hypothetical protein